MTKKIWTPAEVIKEMNDGIRQFGEYNFFDKGPSEVMDIYSICDYLDGLTANEIHSFIKELRGNTEPYSKREKVCGSILVQLQYSKWTDEEFEHICDASPGSF